MNKRAFLIHVGANRVHLLTELKKRGMEVVFFTTTDAPLTQIYESLAPGVPNVTNAHALSLRSPLLGTPPPANLDDIKAIADSEQVALHCFDRANADRRSMHDLHGIYLEHVGMWRKVLDQYDPQVVVFTDNPHHGWDNVLYDLCRRDGRSVAIIGYSELDTRLIIKSAVDDSPGPSPQEIDDVIARGGAIDDVRRDKVNLGNNQRINDISRIRKKTSLLAATRLMVGVRQFGRTPPMGLLFRGDETPRYIKIRWALFRNRLAGRRLLKVWDSLSVDADVSRAYVYFPLPMQPESTTVPLAGHFSEQVNLVRTVAAALPKGWTLFVKEHPAQILWTLSSRGRTPRQYEQLAAIPNVQLIKLEVNGLYLAQRARAVATATGTSGFEALEAGVPALVFASPWYAMAPGVARVKSVEEAREALGRVERGELKPTPERVRAYKHLMATRYSVKAIFDPETALREDAEPEVTAANLAAAIQEVVERQVEKASIKRLA